MGIPWESADSAAPGYLDEWVPRFVPYHADLLRELAVRQGQRVLVPCAGPGFEVAALARAVGGGGIVRATDANSAMVRLAADRIRAAGVSATAAAVRAPSDETAGGPWDAIFCAYGLASPGEVVGILDAWRRSLTPTGKVGIVAWGPSEASGPFARFRARFGEVGRVGFPDDKDVTREAMMALFSSAGLELVRHTVVRHTMAFATAAAFVRAMTDACVVRNASREDLDRAAAGFYADVGGPDAPLSFESPSTIAIACLPGAEVELDARPSVRAPSQSQLPKAH
jgi:protein-L-isoaspartate O-methyltransferase